VRKVHSTIFLISWLLVGCNLAGDFTPPSALATSQAAPSLVQPTAQPLTTPTATADADPLVEDAELERDTSEDNIMQGIVRGQITNGSEGGVLPEFIEVTLYGFDDQEEVFSKTAIANESGEYQFSDVEIQPGRVYVATVDYQGAIYASEIVHINEDAELDLPITIFESTNDLTNVRVDRMHVIIDMPTEGVLQVTELWILSNLGDRTIASDSGDGILTVQLPADAVNLNFESGMAGTRFEVTAGGFRDLFPIRPGQGSHEIVFSFNISFDKSLDFSQPVTYPVEAVVMLTPEGILMLKGEGVQDMGARQMTGMTLHNYSKDPMSAGDALEFLVKRESGSGIASGGSDSMVEIVLGAVVFVAALGGTGFWLYRRKKETAIALDGLQWSEELTTDLEELDDQDEILQAIADLDDAHEAGEIEYASYQERREGLKTRLVEIMKQARND
jgi:hypothetical protein